MQNTKKEDELSKSIQILCNNTKWSTHSIDCTGEKVSERKSLRKDSQTCNTCYNFPSISVIRFRIRMMERILHLEQYLIESKSSETGNIAVSIQNFESYC